LVIPEDAILAGSAFCESKTPYNLAESVSKVDGPVGDPALPNIAGAVVCAD
jgi:hypothetical protein